MVRSLAQTKASFNRLRRAKGGFDYLHAAASGTKYEDLVAAALTSPTPVRTAASTIIRLAAASDPMGALRFIQLITHYHVGMGDAVHQSHLELVMQATRFTRGR